MYTQILEYIFKVVVPVFGLPFSILCGIFLLLLQLVLLFRKLYQVLTPALAYHKLQLTAFHFTQTRPDWTRLLSHVTRSPPRKKSEKQE